MADIRQIGLKFELRKDWKILFQKDVWFMWQNRRARNGYVLRRFTLLNVFRWYFYQFVIWLLTRTLRPLALMADHYWNSYEGREFKEITRASLSEAIKPIKFFRLDY